MNDSNVSWPKISIITPSYNQGCFLEKSILSVIQQDYPNFEYFVIDGGSTDESIEIIKRHEDMLSGWVGEPDHGQAHAINKGFKNSSGDIFYWLNADDYLLEGSLTHIAKHANKNKEAAAWVGTCRRISPDGKLLSTVVPRNLTQAGIADWSRKGFFYQPACFFSAQAWQDVGPLDESLQIAMDLDLWLRLADWGEFVVTEQVIAEAVIHQGAKTQRRRSAMQAETIYLQVKYGYLDVAADNLQSQIDRYRWSQLPARIWRWISYLLKRRH